MKHMTVAIRLVVAIALGLAFFQMPFILWLPLLGAALVGAYAMNRRAAEYEEPPRLP